MGGPGEVGVKVRLVVQLLFMLNYPWGEVNLKILKVGGLRLGRVKVTWYVGGCLNSEQKCSQRVKPEFLMWLSYDGPSMTRMWVGLSLSVKVSWLSWFNIRVGIGDEEWISMIWLRGGRWLSLGRYVQIGGNI